MVDERFLPFISKSQFPTPAMRVTETLPDGTERVFNVPRGFRLEMYAQDFYKDEGDNLNMYWDELKPGQQKGDFVVEVFKGKELISTFRGVYEYDINHVKLPKIKITRG